MNEQIITASESVPGVQELFSPESITELENASDLCKRVYAMRTQEKRLADMLSRAEISKVYQLCQARVAKQQAEQGLTMMWNPYAEGTANWLQQRDLV